MPLLRPISVIASVLLAAACEPPPAEEARDERPTSATLADGGVRLDARARPFVTVEAVGSNTSGVIIRSPARIQFRDNAISRVGSPIPARVMKLHVQVGDLVKVGDQLATLTSPDASGYHAELARARVELAAGRDTLKRHEAMVAKGVGREFEKVTAEMRVRDAEERVRAAKRDVDLLGTSFGGTVIVTSQIEGTVLRRNASIGAQVDPAGDPLFEIGNPKDLWVVADVFQDDLPLVKTGAPVDVELTSARKIVRGEVVSVGVLLDTAVRRAPVYVAVDPDELTGVKAGMFARAMITADDVDGITVPVNAVLIKDGHKSIVYVEREDGAFVRRDIIVGHDFEDRVEIASGLEAGDRVAVEGALLIDGAANQLL